MVTNLEALHLHVKSARAQGRREGLEAAVPLVRALRFGLLCRLRAFEHSAGNHRDVADCCMKFPCLSITDILSERAKLKAAQATGTLPGETAGG